MDVTFFEDQSFYPNSEIQGENSQESPNWDLMSLVGPEPPIVESTEPPIPEPPILESAEPLLESATLPQHRREIQVYTRRNRVQSQPQIQPEQTQHDQSPISVSNSEENSESKEISVPISYPDKDIDLDVPRAIRKGVRTCTQHPLHKHVSYARLSPKFKAFVS